MRHPHAILTAVAITLLALVPACSSPTPTPTATPTPLLPPTEPATIKVQTVEAIGTFITDGTTAPLYLFTGDIPKSGMSACTGSCARRWPPLLTGGFPKADAGINESLLGTIRRPDGHMQVTYNGWPLHYHESADLAGDGFGVTWFMVSPQGNVMIPGQIVSVPTPTATPTPTTAPPQTPPADITATP